MPIVNRRPQSSPSECSGWHSSPWSSSYSHSNQSTAKRCARWICRSIPAPYQAAAHHSPWHHPSTFRRSLPALLLLVWRSRATSRIERARSFSFLWTFCPSRLSCYSCWSDGSWQTGCKSWTSLRDHRGSPSGARSLLSWGKGWVWLRSRRTSYVSLWRCWRFWKALIVCSGTVSLWIVLACRWFFWARSPFSIY